MKEYLKPEVIVLDKKNMPAVFLSGDGICFWAIKPAQIIIMVPEYAIKAMLDAAFVIPLKKKRNRA